MNPSMPFRRGSIVPTSLLHGARKLPTIRYTNQQRVFKSASLVPRTQLALLSRKRRPALDDLRSLPITSMAENKGRKQATLGYVRDSQMTLGCVDI